MSEKMRKDDGDIDEKITLRKEVGRCPKTNI